MANAIVLSFLILREREREREMVIVKNMFYYIFLHKTTFLSFMNEYIDVTTLEN